jgi:hypothetical protein
VSSGYKQLSEYYLDNQPDGSLWLGSGTSDPASCNHTIVVTARDVQVPVAFASHDGTALLRHVLVIHSTMKKIHRQPARWDAPVVANPNQQLADLAAPDPA